MDGAMPGKPMALNVTNKTNGQVTFLYRKSSFLTLWLTRNAMQCPHTTTL